MDPLSLARRITTLPATIQTSTRQRIARSLEQLRIALDLPSRRELNELTTRLEALDARIAGLAAQRVSEMTRVVATLPEGQPEAAAEAVAVAAEVAGEAPAVVEAAAVAGADLANLDVTASATLPAAGANGANGAANHHRHGKKKPLKNRR